MNNILTLGLILTVVASVGCASHDAALPDRDESNQIVEIIIDNDSDSLNLNIQAIRSLNNAFTIDKPARIVFDIFKIKSPHFVEQKIRVQSKVARQIRYCGHPDKLRLVIDTQKEYLSKYSSVSTDTGLIIKVGKLQK